MNNINNINNFEQDKIKFKGKSKTSGKAGGLSLLTAQSGLIY